MICHRISETLGLTCNPLTDDGLVAMIDSPFRYPDGDNIPISLKNLDRKFGFFDDGGAILHLLGRGILLDGHRKTKFIRNLTEPFQVRLNESGELEIWSTEAEAPASFANYISAMLCLAKWEGDQVGVATDISLFLDEVELCLRAWKPGWWLLPRRNTRAFPDICTD
jgi:hypothetical protein